MKFMQCFHNSKQNNNTQMQIYLPAANIVCSPLGLLTQHPHSVHKIIIASCAAKGRKSHKVATAGEVYLAEVT